MAEKGGTPISVVAQPMSDPRTPQRLIDLLARGIELPAERREVFCRAECADDPAMLVELMSLLKAHDRGLEGFLEQPIALRVRRVADADDAE